MRLSAPLLCSVALMFSTACGMSQEEIQHMVDTGDQSLAARLDGVDTRWPGEKTDLESRIDSVERISERARIAAEQVNSDWDKAYGEMIELQTIRSQLVALRDGYNASLESLKSYLRVQIGDFRATRLALNDQGENIDVYLKTLEEALEELSKVDTIDD